MDMEKYWNFVCFLSIVQSVLYLGGIEASPIDLVFTLFLWLVSYFFIKSF